MAGIRRGVAARADGGAARRRRPSSNRSTGNVLTLALPAAHKHLADKVYADKLKAALDQATGRKWMLAFEVGSAAEASLAAQKKRAQAEAEVARPRRRFRDEPFVQDVLGRFDAKIKPDSIKPLSTATMAPPPSDDPRHR